MVDANLKVLMLGWEFPPQITGGLGTACQGLSRALAHRGVDIQFLMPHLYGSEEAPYMDLLDVKSGKYMPREEDPFTMTETIQRLRWLRRRAASLGLLLSEDALQSFQPVQGVLSGVQAKSNAGKIKFYALNSALSPYRRPQFGAISSRSLMEWIQRMERLLHTAQLKIGNRQANASGLSVGMRADRIRQIFFDEEMETEYRSFIQTQGEAPISTEQSGSHYGDGLFHEVFSYAERVLQVVTDLEMDFDVIHAHDWMTYPAAIWLQQAFQRPTLLHVHSLEADRSGSHPHQQIAEIESWGLHSADQVVAVSHFTRQKIMQNYNVNAERIDVAHNGIEFDERPRRYKRKTKNLDGIKRVLFLGRVTFQKGPDYFVEAALKVLRVLPQTEFILAGSGDMLPRLRHRIEEAGAKNNFRLTGFLARQQVDEIFAQADLYVMPSVSEPFGISVLEALHHEVPVIVSKQSGVSEVIQHALKVDFWDIDELADLIIGALKFSEMRDDMVHMGVQELEPLNWGATADKVLHVYRKMLSAESATS